MSANNVSVRLEQVFMDTFKKSHSDDVVSMEYNKSSGWDSVAHMSLIAHIESEFEIMLEIDDILGLSSFTKAVEIVLGYVAD